jgi:hypothetical protein
MKARSQTEQKAFERLDRHVRTSASLRELAHWDEARSLTRLSKSHDAALRKEIKTRFLALNGGGA